jgi:Rieske Fe-S protein
MSEVQPVISRAVTSRRVLLAGAGAIGATAALAACGTDPDEDTGSGTGDGGQSQTATPGTGGGALAKTSEIPVEGGTIFAAQSVVVTQPTQGEFKAFSSTCSHQGCPVTSVDGGTINCNCHGSKFSIEDGSVKTGPATKPLTAREIKVEGENITLA